MGTTKKYMTYDSVSNMIRSVSYALVYFLKLEKGNYGNIFA